MRIRIPHLTDPEDHSALPMQKTPLFLVQIPRERSTVERHFQARVKL